MRKRDFIRGLDHAYKDYKKAGYHRKLLQIMSGWPRHIGYLKYSWNDLTIKSNYCAFAEAVGLVYDVPDHPEPTLSSLKNVYDDAECNKTSGAYKKASNYWHRLSVEQQRETFDKWIKPWIEKKREEIEGGD